MLGPLAGQGGQDLVVIALSGVQRFISESRATSDLSSASEVIERLAIEAATVCRNAYNRTELVLWAPSP